MISKHAGEEFPSSLTTAQRKALGPLPAALHCASKTKKVTLSKFHLKVPQYREILTLWGWKEERAPAYACPNGGDERTHAEERGIRTLMWDPPTSDGETSQVRSYCDVSVKSNLHLASLEERWCQMNNLD